MEEGIWREDNDGVASISEMTFHPLGSVLVGEFG